MSLSSIGRSRSILTTIAWGAGRSAGRARTIGGASRVGAFQAGAAVSVLWGAVHSVVNLRKYRKGMISRGKAIRETAHESIGIGLATGLGIFAVSAVRASALLASGAALVPFVVGTAVTGTAKALWDRAAKGPPPLVQDGNKQQEQSHRPTRRDEHKAPPTLELPTSQRGAECCDTSGMGPGLHEGQRPPVRW